MRKQATVSKDTRIAIAAFELVQDGLSVSEVCRRLAISRDTYYRYRRRFAREGPVRAGAALDRAGHQREHDPT